MPNSAPGPSETWLVAAAKPSEPSAATPRQHVARTAVGGRVVRERLRLGGPTDHGHAARALEQVALAQGAVRAHVRGAVGPDLASALRPRDLDRADRRRVGAVESVRDPRHPAEPAEQPLLLGCERGVAAV